MKRVLIIDDEPLARMVLQEYLQGMPQFEVIQECGDGFEGIEGVLDMAFAVIQVAAQGQMDDGFGASHAIRKCSKRPGRSRRYWGGEASPEESRKARKGAANNSAWRKEIWFQSTIR